MTHSVSINLKFYVPDFLEKFAVLILLWLRKKITGHPYRRIKLTQGKYTKVDPRDYPDLIGYPWYAARAFNNFYVQRKENGKTIKMHRQIMNPPPHLFVDHKNHDGLDNRRANLRIATPAENAFNKRKERGPHTSKYKGVHLIKGTKKYKASIRYLGERLCLGHFDTEEDAARAYDEAAKKLFGGFACLNFPQVAEGIG